MLTRKENILNIKYNTEFLTPETVDDPEDDVSYPNSFTDLKELEITLRVLVGITSDEREYLIFKRKFENICYDKFKFIDKENVYKDTKVDTFFRIVENLRNRESEYHCYIKDFDTIIVDMIDGTNNCTFSIMAYPGNSPEYRIDNIEYFTPAWKDPSLGDIDFKEDTCIDTATDTQDVFRTNTFIFPNI